MKADHPYNNEIEKLDSLTTLIMLRMEKDDCEKYNDAWLLKFIRQREKDTIYEYYILIYTIKIYHLPNIEKLEKLFGQWDTP